MRSKPVEVEPLVETELEELLGTITGLRGNDDYSICFTTQRIIIVKVLKGGKLFLKSSALEMIGPGIIGDAIFATVWTKGMKAAEKESNKIKTLSPEDIPDRGIESIEIPYDDIKKIEMKNPGKLITSTINIHTNNNKYKYRVPRKDLYECQKLIGLVSNLINEEEEPEYAEVIDY